MEQNNRVDFSLSLSIHREEKEHAQMLQLMLEYNPQPPFQAGSPEGAGADLTSQVREMRAPAVEAARQAALIAQKRLANT